MKQRTVNLGRLVAATLLVLLGGCGGSGDTSSNGPAVAMSEARSDQTSGYLKVSGPDQTPKTSAASLPAVCDGLHVSVYASVSEPMKLSFAPDGALYVGRQGGNRIHRVAPGGGSVAEFGPPQVDPDAVLFDASGRISGVPNSVLVGGGGVLAAIFPDQTSAVIFNSGFADVDDMKFDHRRRLVFSDDLPQVLVSKGSPPAVLFSTPSRPGSVAIDDHNRIFVTLADGTIRTYNEDGTAADNAFATGLAGLDTYLAFGPGEGGFGKALYVLNGQDLLRFDRRGAATTIGSGFSIGPSSGTGFVFGPDKALYVSDYPNNRILKIEKGGKEGGHCPRH